MTFHNGNNYEYLRRESQAALEEIKGARDIHMGIHEEKTRINTESKEERKATKIADKEQKRLQEENQKKIRRELKLQDEFDKYAMRAAKRRKKQRRSSNDE